jgi:hypothetical protein
MKGEHMFPRKPQETGLDEAITEILSEMKGFTSDSEDYATMVNHLVTLHKLKETNSSKRVSADTMAIVAGNLLGILAILSYERVHVVTSKALSFAGKLR